VQDDAKPKTKIALSKSKILMKVAQVGRKRIHANKEDGENAKKKKKVTAPLDPSVKAAKEAEKAKKAAEKVEKQKQREEKKKKSKKVIGHPSPSPVG
jgi:hypothetical protein